MHHSQLGFRYDCMISAFKVYVMSWCYGVYFENGLWINTKIGTLSWKISFISTKFESAHQNVIFVLKESVFQTKSNTVEINTT